MLTLAPAPHPLLSASCLPVAQAHPPLSRELFNVAFFSVWLQLDQEARIKLKVNLETVRPSRILVCISEAWQARVC